MEIFNIVPEDFLKGVSARNHAYFTHLVPVKKTGKDGIRRTYWVNPSEMKKKPSPRTKKHKLTMIDHLENGNKDDHLSSIKTKHDIDSKDVSHFHAGDKVKVLIAPAAQKDLKGKEVFFRGSLTRSKTSTPMVSVVHKDEKTGKKKLFNVNINNVEKTSDATEETKAIVSKGTQKTNIKGETILTDGKKKRAKKETSKEAIEREENLIETGSSFQNKAGQQFMITKVFDSGLIKITALKPKGKFKWRLKKKETVVQERTFKTWIKREGIRRMPPKKSLKAKDSFSYPLEAGLAHINGLIVYNEAGKAKWADTAEAKKYANDLMTENMGVVDAAIVRINKKYSLVDSLDFSAGDFWETCKDNMAQYNPYKGNSAGGVTSRMNMFLDGSINDKMKRVQEERMINQSIETDAYDSEATPVEKVPLEAITTTTIPGGGYVNITHQMALEEGLSDERDVLDYYFGVPLISDFIQRWLGLGRFEADLTTDEVSKMLVGMIYNDKGTKLISAGTIKTEYLPKTKKDLMSWLRARSKTLPELEHTISQNVRLRNTIKSKKEYSDSKDDIPPIVKRKMKRAKTVYDGGKKGRAILAARLITHGIDHKKVGHYVEVVEKILNAKMVPEEYPKEVTLKDSNAIESTLASIYKLKGTKDLPRRLQVKNYVGAKHKKGIADDDVAGLKAFKKLMED